MRCLSVYYLKHWSIRCTFTAISAVYSYFLLHSHLHLSSRPLVLLTQSAIHELHRAQRTTLLGVLYLKEMYMDNFFCTGS